MSNKDKKLRSRKGFGEKSGVDRNKIADLYIEEMSHGEFSEEAKKFEEDENPTPAL